MFRSTLVVAALLGFALAAPAHAHEGKATTSTLKEMSFEGTIESVDVATQNFTVRNVEKGTTREMEFHVSEPTGVHLEGQVVLLGELHPGDRVTVTYEESGTTHVARNVHRHAKAASKEMSFEGTVESIDAPAQDFTVRNVEKGTTHEMKFHVAEPTGVRMDGRVVLLSQLHPGDPVTVTYEESGTSHVAHDVHRHAKTASR